MKNVEMDIAGFLVSKNAQK